MARSPALRRPKRYGSSVRWGGGDTAPELSMRTKALECIARPLDHLYGRSAELDFTPRHLIPASGRIDDRSPSGPAGESPRRVKLLAGIGVPRHRSQKARAFGRCACLISSKFGRSPCPRVPSACSAISARSGISRTMVRAKLPSRQCRRRYRCARRPTRGVQRAYIARDPTAGRSGQMGERQRGRGRGIGALHERLTSASSTAPAVLAPTSLPGADALPVTVAADGEGCGVP